MFQYFQFLGFAGFLTAILIAGFKYAANKFTEINIKSYELRLANDLKIKEFEHSVKFSKLHETRAEIIRIIYVKFMSVQSLFHEFIPATSLRQIEILDQLDVEGLAEYLLNNRIYFSKELCDILLSMVFALSETETEFKNYYKSLSGKMKIEPYPMSNRFKTIIETDFVKALNKIEDEFRSVIGVH